MLFFVFSAMESFRYKKLLSDDNFMSNLDDSLLTTDHVPSMHMDTHTDGRNMVDVDMMTHDDNDDDVDLIIRNSDDNNAASSSCSLRHPLLHTEQNGTCLVCT